MEGIGNTKVSMKEAQEFMSIKKKGAKPVAAAVALCILSPALLILLSGFAEAQKFQITETIAVAVGVTVLLLFVTAAVALFIYCGIREKRLEYLTEENLELEADVEELVRGMEKAYEGTYARELTAGIACCILAVIPLVIAGVLESEDSVCCGMVSLLLVFVAVGVYMIVKVGIVNGSFHTLLQTGEYSKEEKMTKKKVNLFASAYWCIVTAVYLGSSFLTMRWDMTWIIWPVTGVMYPAFAAIIKAAGMKNSTDGN